MTHLPELTDVQVRALRAIAEAEQGRIDLDARTTLALRRKDCIAESRDTRGWVSSRAITPMGRSVLEYHARRDRRRAQRQAARSVGGVNP